MSAAAADGLADLRRRLHAQPETGLHLPQTQAAVLDALAGLGLEVTTGSALSSVTAVLRGGRRPSGAAPAVLLRGDMDALPLVEQSGEPFSAVGEAMHACGHDLHTAALVGAARLLAARAGDLPGDVVFMFQPGEEGWDGAARMIEEGVLDASGNRVGAAYGVHVQAGLLPRGVFATRPGPLMAASSSLFVTVRGRGGHASRPYVAADPIVAAAEMVTALQTMVTRQVDVFDPAVLTVGLFTGGTRRNIIPETAGFEATVRTFTPRALDRVRTGAVRLCHGVAAAHGVTAEVTFDEEYPVTVNDTDRAAYALEVAADLFGADRSRLLATPLMGSEDFSRVLAAVPGAFVFLGASVAEDPDTVPGNHAAGARFDDTVLPDAARFLTELAVRDLDRLVAGYRADRVPSVLPGPPASAR